MSNSVMDAEIDLDNINTAYNNNLHRLNTASVKKNYNPYIDIPWDDPDFAVDRDDPRWILPAYDPLGGTDWYQNLPATTQANLALERTAQRVKKGVVFENIVIRGLVTFSASLPNNSIEFRYVLHESIEESYHSLMFQEFVNRSSYNPENLTKSERFLAHYLIKKASKFPEIFLLFVLAGEEPIDFEQQKQLKQQKNLHPLMKLMNKIHITEEARHINFASSYIEKSIPKLSAWKKLKLCIMAPMILGNMGKSFLEPPIALIKTYDIPKEMIKAVYNDEERKQELRLAMNKTVTLCQQLGLMTSWNQWLWRYYSLIK
jgi:hypothetical protein